MMGEELRGARLDLGRNQYMNRLQTDRHMADCALQYLMNKTQYDLS